MLAILLKIDFLSVNPQLTQRARLRGRKGANLIFSLLQQIFFTSLIFMVIYGLTIFPIDFYRFPGLMSYYFLLFNGLALLQGVTSIVHLFFNEQGLKEYIPLPVTLQEIYLSKSLIALLTMASYSLPCIFVFIDYGWYHRSNLFAVFLLAILIYLCLLLINYALVNLSLLIFSFVPKFAAYQKRFSQLLMIVMTILVVWSILYVNQLNIYTQVQPIPLIYPFIYIFNQPFSLTSIGWLAFLLLLTLASLSLMVWLSHNRLSRYQWQLLAVVSPTLKEKKHYRLPYTLNQFIYRYHFRLIRDYRFIFQVLLASLMIPLIFIWQLAQKLPSNLGTPNFAILILLGGVFLSAYTIHPQSFIANLFSLERQNLVIMYQLPINQFNYIKQKFIFGTCLQLVLNLALYGLFLYQFHLSIANMLCGLFGIILGTIGYGSYYFTRDYQNPYTKWTDYFQLLNRKANGFKMLLLYGGQLLAQAILLMGIYQMLDSTYIQLINLLILGLLILIIAILGYCNLKIFKIKTE